MTRANLLEMGIAGAYREVSRPDRIVNTEKFDEAWYPGDAIVTTEFTERDGKTLVTTTILYDTREARDLVLASPMESGVRISYDRLAAMLPSLTKRTA